jgi:hypothetical protein
MQKGESALSPKTSPTETLKTFARLIICPRGGATEWSSIPEMVEGCIPDSLETSSNDICFLVLRDLILSPIFFWAVIVFLL